MFWLTLSFTVFFAVMCIVGIGAIRNTPRRKRDAILHLLGLLLFFGGILNFIVFWHVAVSIGGDAVSGKFENGKYFVSSHGKLTEVSEATWRYSYAHTVSTWITHPLAGLGFLLLYLADPERKKAPNRTSEPTLSRESPPAM